MRLIIGFSVLVACLIGAGALYATGQQDEPPGRPDWVTPGGKVKPDRMPEYVTVAGPDGIVICSNGKQLKVRSDQLTGPPPLPPKALEAQQRRNPQVTFTWRCGTGENPDLNAQQVPADE